MKIIIQKKEIQQFYRLKNKNKVLILRYMIELIHFDFILAHI